MRVIVRTLLAAMSFFLIAQVHAHGITEPQHGGIVKVVGDVSLELVAGPGRVEVYILDDAPWDTAGMSGKLKVDGPEGKSEYELVPGGESGLVADGVSLAAGSTVLAIITRADGYSKIAGKFTLE